MSEDKANDDEMSKALADFDRDGFVVLENVIKPELISEWRKRY